MSVKIVDYSKRTSRNGDEFFALFIEGGLEMVLSKQTGRYYATSKRTSITSTFDEATCRELIGEKIPGSVQKVECDPYEVTIRDTGEIVTLNHRWIYLPEGETITERIIAESEVMHPVSI